MASETLPTERVVVANGEPVIDMADLGARVAARKTALGLPDVPRNGGECRTASKRGLLKAIEDAGVEW